MRRIIPILIAVLVVQVALTLYTWSGDRNSDDLGKPLASFKTSEIDHITLIDGDKGELTLVKKGVDWIMPHHFETRADGNRITAFIKKISLLKSGWPVATTDSAATRFQVAGDQFKVKIVLSGGDKEMMTLYLGDSAGVRSAYLRIKDSSDIYRSSLASYNFPTDPDKWLDSSILQQDVKNINAIKCNDFTISRKNDGFTLQDADNQEVDTSAAKKLFSTLANLIPDTVLGMKKEPSYNLASPELKITAKMKDGSSREYVFGKREKKADGYVLKISDQKLFFKISKGRISNLLTASRETLAKKKSSAKKTDSVD